jgi:SAF domain
MTTTATPPRAQQGARLPVRTRDRRPALAALAILLIMLGALGSALIAYRTGDRVDVLVAAREIPQGTQVTAEDFTVARVAHDGGAVVEADSLSAFVGAYSTARIPEGALVANTMFTVDGVVPEGGQLVGVAASTVLRPSETLGADDMVRLYSVPPEGSGDSETVVEAARIVHVAAGAPTSDLVHLTVLVPDGDAAEVVQLNAYGQLGLAKLPDGTEPVIDLLTQ